MCIFEFVHGSSASTFTAIIFDLIEALLSTCFYALHFILDIPSDLDSPGSLALPLLFWRLGHLRLASSCREPWFRCRLLGPFLSQTPPGIVFAVHHLIPQHLCTGQTCIMFILRLSKLHLGSRSLARTARSRIQMQVLLPAPEPVFINHAPPCPEFRNLVVGVVYRPPIYPHLLPGKRDLNFILCLGKFNQKS